MAFRPRLHGRRSLRHRVAEPLELCRSGFDHHLCRTIRRSRTEVRRHADSSRSDSVRQIDPVQLIDGVAPGAPRHVAAPQGRLSRRTTQARSRVAPHRHPAPQPPSENRPHPARGQSPAPDHAHRTRRLRRDGTRYVASKSVGLALISATRARARSMQQGRPERRPGTPADPRAPRYGRRPRA
jgi:hypothetical protein